MRTPTPRSISADASLGRAAALAPFSTLLPFEVPEEMLQCLGGDCSFGCFSRESTGNSARTACLSSLVGRVPWLCFSLTFRRDSPFAPGGRWHQAFCRCQCSECCARFDLQVLVFFHIVWMRRHRGTLSLCRQPFRPSSIASALHCGKRYTCNDQQPAGQRDQLATEMDVSLCMVQDGCHDERPCPSFPLSNGSIFCGCMPKAGGMSYANAGMQASCLDF